MVLEEFRMWILHRMDVKDHQVCQVPIEFPVMTEVVQSADRSKADFSAFFAVAEQTDCFQKWKSKDDCPLAWDW